MKYTLILLGLFGSVCLGHTAEDRKFNNQLLVQITIFLCQSDQEPSLCNPVKNLTEAEARYGFLLKSEEGALLRKRLDEQYITEVDPYIEDICIRGFPIYMAMVCEALDTLIITEGKLQQALNEPVNHENYQILERIIEGTRHEIKKAQSNYRVMRQITMEMLCDRKEGPTSFCNLLSVFKKYTEENYQAAETELADAVTALNLQIDVICKREKGQEKSKFYTEILCGIGSVNLVREWHRDE